MQRAEIIRSVLDACDAFSLISLIQLSLVVKLTCFEAQVPAKNLLRQLSGEMRSKEEREDLSLSTGNEALQRKPRTATQQSFNKSCAQYSVLFKRHSETGSTSATRRELTYLKRNSANTLSGAPGASSGHARA